jgi:hypothetical protein
MPSLVTSIIGGIQGRSAAKNAAKENAAAADSARAQLLANAERVNPAITLASTVAGAGVRTSAEAAAAAAREAAARAAGGVTGATSTAATGIRDAGATAGAGVTAATTQANELLDPYLTAGGDAMTRLTAGLGPGGGLDEKFDASMLPDDPSYQFRLNEGMKALERSAAARGAGQGGAAAKALTRYSQGVASTEYAAAFDRFERGKADKFKQLELLSGVAGLGANASARAGENLTAGARYAGDIGVGTERTAGDFEVGGARYGGDADINAAQFGANAGTRAAEYEGNTGIRAAEVVAQNTTDAARAGADLTMAAGDARAQGHVGAANAWNGMLSGIGRVGDAAIAGGLAGGTGFNLRGVFRQPTPPSTSRLVTGRSGIPGYPA